MTQMTFAECEYANKKRKTRREKFLEQMESLIPWKQLENKIRRHYPRSGIGRPPYPLSVMLRIHCMQLFYNLSDPAMEDALYEIASMRNFAGLRLHDRLPDETTILNFRHLLERHNLGEAIFKAINKHLSNKGLELNNGTIVDASIIAAPTSTKNKDKSRDPEMHQTKKGGEYHFGMKVHVGVDDRSGLIHSLSTTAANAHDITEVPNLLHGEEDVFWGDAAFVGADKRDENKDRNIVWMVSQRIGCRKNMCKVEIDIEKGIAAVRASVEHVFARIKNQFGYRKVRYRGLAKNTNRLYVLAGFTNLLRSRSALLP